MEDSQLYVVVALTFITLLNVAIGANRLLIAIFGGVLGMNLFGLLEG